MDERDDALLERARRFEEPALVEVYDRYHQDLYRYAWRLLGEVDLAEECVAETFSRFLHALKNQGGPRQHLRAYLYRIAHNWITDYYRRGPLPELALETDSCADLAADEMTEPAQAARWRSEQQEVRAALERLTPEQRQVIVLRYLEEWEIEEIAEALQKPAGAVKSLQHRGIQALKRLFDPQKERTYVETLASSR